MAHVVRSVAGLPELDHAPAPTVDGRGWSVSHVTAVMTAHGSQVGMLMARGGRCDVIYATVVCLAPRLGMTLPGSHVEHVPSKPPGGPICTVVPERAGPQLFALSDGGCPGVAG